MYEQNKISANWLKIGLRILIVILCVLLLFKIVVVIKDNKTNVIEQDEMKEKINLLEEVGKKYFDDDKLPKEIGDSQTITLKELVDAKLIDEIKDKKDKTCDSEKSYVKVTRLDKEYQIKTLLTCDNFEDYKNSFVEIKKQELETITTTTKTTTKKTTKKATKKYEISFNPNGGSLLDEIYVEENKVVTNIGTPERPGYEFIGWYYHGTPFDLNTKINQDYVLVAKWIKE
ncbi:MAG: InlB B-repeat-containing protein [Erysipelotrichales bacterium]|nr:InlB B-repeat-containing protein [Erysipelotrichales bacterium]